MDINKIEILLRAIELGSLSKAANEFMYSTSALSQMVDSLESEIGTKLIKRTHNGIEVIDGKNNVVALLKNLVKTQNDVFKAVQEFNGNVTIATYGSVSKHILAKSIKEFKTSFPNININIIVADRFNKLFSEGAADLFFGEKFNDELVWVPILEDPYVAVMSKDFDFSDNKISAEKLLQYPFIMVKDSLLARYIKKNTVNNKTYNTSSDDSSVIELIKEGLYVSIMPEFTVGNAKGIKTVPITPQISRTLGLMYNQNEYKENPNLRKFTDFLNEYVNKNTAR